MRKMGIALLIAASLALPAGAQTKLHGKQTCQKSDPSYMVDVGDQPGHAIMLQKTTCTWADGGLDMEGLKSKGVVDVSTGEMRGVKMTDSGYNTTTMDNGDKFTVHYSGPATAAKDGSVAFAGKWTFVSGTGKLKGIKGGGTYKGSGTADGAGSAEIEGEYAIAPPAAAKPKAPTTPAAK